MPPKVPEEWKHRLKAYLQDKCGESRDRLSATDFPADQSVAIHFSDGSFALFKYAFAIWDETGRECAVFTEHCGYHIFSVDRTEVEILRSLGEVSD